MNLMRIFKHYPDQEACIEHLEAVRWGSTVKCPQCASTHVARKGDGKRVGRWNCHACHASFNVLSGTIMEKTKIPLQKWFLTIWLMVNAKKNPSSYQLARDLGLNQKSAWYMKQRILEQMASEQCPIQLESIVGAEETHGGGKPRKPNCKDDDTQSDSRSRSTSKTPIKDVVESRDCRTACDFLPHAMLQHLERYVEDLVYANAIQGALSLFPRAWYDSLNHYTQVTALPPAKTAWKYIHCEDDGNFGAFVQAVAP